MEYSLEKAVGKAIVLAVEFPGVKIDRNEFLQKNFSKYFEPLMVNEIINTSPIEAKVDDKILNEIAINCIDYEKYKVTLLSAGAGVGGITTVPADMVQYFAHVFRISQKLAYVYGWPDIFNCGDDIDKTFDEETQKIFFIFMGVMYGVDGAVSILKELNKCLGEKIAKDLIRQSLTKTVWYPVLKEIAKQLGIKITKKNLSNFVYKSIPIISGAIAGGMTYYAFSVGAERLHASLKKYPVK